MCLCTDCIFNYLRTQYATLKKPYARRGGGFMFMFFAQIQADSFLIIFFSGLICSKYRIFPLKILNNHN